MRREGNLYANICSIKNIKNAHRHARKDKTYYKDVQIIDADPTPYFEAIRDMLINHEYTTSEYTIFEKFDAGKIRTIYKLPYFPDRIVHWAVMLQIEHLFRRVFCDCTHAAIPGHGIHSAMIQVKSYTDKDPIGTKYCLKLDVQKFFPSINHSVLKYQLRKIIKDPDVLWLLDSIIDSIPDNLGIPIGNYLSQYFANLYLSWFDHWVKEILHIKYYTRYMDDIVILSSSKDQLWGWLNKIRNYLKDELFLTIKHNYAVFPIESRAIDFAGYKNRGCCDNRSMTSIITLRKTTWKRMRRTLLDIKTKIDRGGKITLHEYCQYNSYQGWYKRWCVGKKIEQLYFRPLLPAMKIYYQENIKNDERNRNLDPCRV